MPGTLQQPSRSRSMSDGWFHTWPERSYDRLEGASPQESPVHRAAVPLSSILSHMSLAYSPITKKLHVLETKPERPQTCPQEDDEPLSIDDPSPKLKIQVSQNSGKDLVLQSCLTKEERCGKQWTSKIGYDEDCSTGRGKSEDSEESDCLMRVLENRSEAVAVENRSETGAVEHRSEAGLNGDDLLIRTGASSFSSIVSSLSDASPCHTDDVAAQARLDDDTRSQLSFDEQSKFFANHSPKVTKKKGISGFFSKNVFAWKGTGSTIGTWKLLGKSMAPSSTVGDSPDSQSHDSDISLRGSSQSINEGGVQKYGDVVASSSALILHDRPSSLPAKSEDERVKHRQEYHDIVEAAKRKEEKDSKQRKKTMQKQLKHEEQLSIAIRTWNCEVLPKWSEMKSNKRTQELWWAGLPPCVRGKVWRLAVANDLNITQNLYQICAARAQERLKSCNGESRTETAGEIDSHDKESSLELIQLDIARTFPQLCIFQKGGPYYDILHCVLGAYVAYRPDVGYVQGMSFLAAILILNLDPADAFICFANILNRPCLHSFFTMSQPMVEAYYETYNELLKENLPKLFDYVSSCGLSPDLYLLEWVYSVFGKSLHLDIACRIWDVFLRDGEEFIFRTALGILHLYEKQLMQLDFVHGAQLLTKLPESLSSDELFKSISSIRMSVGKLTYAQVLASHTPR